MRLAEQQHQGAGLANASADRERQFVVDDALVIREFQVFQQIGDLELAAERVGINTDAH